MKKVNLKKTEPLRIAGSRFSFLIETVLEHFVCIFKIIGIV
ncbi:hypothetical protein C8P63_10874 [Melghirimyces profundicolus]|uniref:Uncharacterized protein n=1 Tax=Melghirimyces profundicolus TaxID=1242148 RepID=A0A2T6BXG1_9BACL|nr:hypothetical protein C8P63_10874 [Melghirimyces profundicolus]